MHNASIAATDLVGNESTSLMFNFAVDSVAPVITITMLPTQSLLINAPLQISGLVSDGDSVTAISVSVVDPDGNQSTDLVDVVGGTWTHTDTTRFTTAGTNDVWVEATDRAGNQRTAGPYALTFASPPIASRLYLPIVWKNYSTQTPAPDLILNSATIITGTATLTVTNAGTASTNGNFRVDLYFDPSVVPTTTVTWQQVSTFGAN